MATWRMTKQICNNLFCENIDFYWDNDGSNNISWSAHVIGYNGDPYQWICCRIFHITGGKNSNNDLTGDLTIYVGAQGSPGYCTDYDNGYAIGDVWASGTIHMGNDGGTLYLGFRGNANGHDRSGYETWNIPALNWTASLNYNMNGGNGGPGNQSQGGISPNTSSYTFVISNTQPTRTNYVFAGWATSSSATSPMYHGGDSYTIQKSSPTKTLYAVWTPINNYVLTYDTNGGTAGPQPDTYSDTAASHTFTVSAVAPTRTAFKFLGWADSSSATTPDYVAGDTITLTSSNKTKTIYAVWGPYYRPGEVLTSGVWKSTSRAEGKCHIRNNGTWREMTTTAGGSGVRIEVVGTPTLSGPLVTSFDSSSFEMYVPQDFGVNLISPVVEIRHTYTVSDQILTIEAELANGDIIVRYAGALDSNAVTISSRLGCTGLNQAVLTPPVADTADTVTLTTTLGTEAIDPPNIRKNGEWVNQVQLGSY